MQAFNPSTRETEAGGSLCFKVSLLYRLRTARAIQRKKIRIMEQELLYEWGFRAICSEQEREQDEVFRAKFMWQAPGWGIKRLQ